MLLKSDTSAAQDESCATSVSGRLWAQSFRLAPGTDDDGAGDDDGFMDYDLRCSHLAESCLPWRVRPALQPLADLHPRAAFCRVPSTLFMTWAAAHAPAGIASGPQPYELVVLAPAAPLVDLRCGADARAADPAASGGR